MFESRRRHHSLNADNWAKTRPGHSPFVKPFPCGNHPRLTFGLRVVGHCRHDIGMVAHVVGLHLSEPVVERLG